MKGQYQRIAGMTLFEIMLALALIALLGTMGVNSWYQYQRKLKLDMVSSQLVTFLTRVQSAANQTNDNYQLQTYEGDAFTGIEVINQDSKRVIPHFNFKRIEKGVDIRPYELLSPVVFYGKRNMASAGHFVVSNGNDEIKIVISARGRIRRCTQIQDKSTQPIMGMALC